MVLARYASFFKYSISFHSLREMHDLPAAAGRWCLAEYISCQVQVDGSHVDDWHVEKGSSVMRDHRDVSCIASFDFA